MKAAVIILVLVIAVLVAISGKLMGEYNQLATERNDIQARWAQLDKDMKNRATLAGNALAAISGRNRQAQSMLQDAGNARAEFFSAETKQAEMAANNRLSAAIARLLRAEVISNQAVQDDLADADQDIANDRKNYNDAIQKYNTDLQLFPHNIAARIFHFQRDDAYFRTPEEDKNVPAVKF